MRYAITTNGQTYPRTREDNDSRLRIFNIGDYPVEVAINGGSYSEPFYRNQSFDISITKTPVTIRSIGGNSEVRTYRVYGSNVDECDIEGYFEPLTVESYESLIAKNAVLKSDIAQNLTNPNEVDVPSTKAVVATLTEFMSNFGSPLRYKGSVKTYNDLPTSDRVVGDMYNVEEPSDDYVAGTNFAWTGEVWDALGGTLSVLPSAITKFNEVVTKAVQDFEELAVVKKTELTEIYENAVLAISGDGGLIDTAEKTLQSYVDQGYWYAVDTHSNLEQVKTLASEVEDDKRQVAALEQSVRANATEIRELKEDLGDISSAVRTATTAEANVRALESSAWLAANRAEEISDPENRIGNLQQTKSNRGEFWFQGGILECSTKWISNFYSFAMTFRMTPEEAILNEVTGTSDYQWLGTCVYGTNQKGFCLSIDPNGTNETKLLVLVFGTKGAESKTIQINNFRSKYCDNKNHSLILVCNPSKLICQIDNDVYSGTPPVFDEIENTRAFKIYSNNSRISRVKYFNFDITDANAPYTIDDYLAGKDESSFLNGRQPSVNWVDNDSDEEVISGNTITYSNLTRQTWPRPFGINPVFETGKTYTFKARKSGTGTPAALFSHIKTNDSWSFGDVENSCEISWSWTNLTTGETGNGSSDTNAMYFCYIFGDNWTGDVETIVKFTPKINGIEPFFAFDPNTSVSLTIDYVQLDGGVLLSLADSIDGVQILDTSGSRNHSTISGVVRSTKENNPARCVDVSSFSWAGTATTQKFANSNIAIPANSKVVAYAKASVAMSASFVCGGNSAVTRELSVNALTEIGTFLNDSSGAFTITPTIVTTGKMEVYLTIERF